MKYCSKCGNEILDEAVICGGCGCPVAVEEQKTETKKKKMSKKMLLGIIISTVAVIALAIGAVFVVNHIRVTKVIEDLSGETFTYFDSYSYPLIGVYEYEEKEMRFDDDGTLTYSYYYSNIDAGDEYERNYKIKFKKGMTFLEAGIDSYEIQYDRYGKIAGIYDVELDELFD